MNVSRATMKKIEINIIDRSFIMEISGCGKGDGMYKCVSLDAAICKARVVLRNANKKELKDKKLMFKVITHGFDANGSPITELITEACG